MGIGVNYNVSTSPSQIGANVKVSISNTTLKAKLQDVGNFGFNITPTGNVAEEIISGVAWPIANIVAASLKGYVIDAIIGTSMDLTTIPSIPVTVEGTTITIQPANMGLSNYNGMLMITGDVNLS
ncbi:MAG: hypothetical protein GY765_20495 [bacterium]|nr:hypothetical protein [bacterium]